MTVSPRARQIALATEVLRDNDRGHYTVPTKGLYPFQWNWDSCLAALGLAHLDEERAWTEIDTLFDNQWEDGMVPHIVFHEANDGYFPGPEVWQTDRKIPTSGITQPAVAGFAIRRLYETARNKKLAEDSARRLLPKIARWHDWFYSHRDPGKSGLVAIIHPWESGRDNSIDWDDALADVPTDGVRPYSRRDTLHADPEHRPTQDQYDRYIWLIQHFRSLGWDNTRLHDASPFQVVDPGFNGILIRSCADLSAVAKGLGEHQIEAKSHEQAQVGLAALDRLWSEARGQYLCYDRRRGDLIDSPSIGGLLPVIAAIDPSRSAKIANRIRKLAGDAKYIVPSHDPSDPRFDGDRYWRGPAWLIVNYLLVNGLVEAGEQQTANSIVESSLDLIQTSGLSEYYDPHTGEGCGGSHFTWTAAMVLEFLGQIGDAKP